MAPATTSPREMLPLWAGVTTGPLVDSMLELADGSAADLPLAPHDVAASIVHVAELERLGLLSADDAAAATIVLRDIARELEAGAFVWQAEHEDVHMNVEAALAARLGEGIAGQLQAGRSRNEEVVTDELVWMREAIGRIDAGLRTLQGTLLDRAEAELRDRTVLPAHTHGQPAQPVLLAHHLLAWVDMFERDRGRLRDAAARADRSPAGSGAVAGSGLALDRPAIAASLGFGNITANSIDAVADRDYAAEFAAGAAIALGHLSRLAGELALWSTPYVGFARLADGYVSGSSMLPNKRNPDGCELVRARAARVQADLAVILEVPRGLPLAYHRDLQETRPAMLDASASLELCLAVMNGMLRTVTFERARMAAAARASHVTATALADRLVQAGVPFRTAHHRVGALVATAEEAGVGVDELPAVELSSALPELAGLAAPVPTLDEALAAPDVAGGTAPRRVAEALAIAQARHRSETRR